jgi:glycosyltransferase involved in cell wall biosynthesis
MTRAPGERPEISVVLATYNRRATLPRAIASVLGQDGAAFELIVVDDGSRDGTSDYLATLADPRIRVVRSERNSGPSAARNRGLAQARASIVAFLDSDDVYRPGRLRVPLSAFAQDAGIVCTLSSAIRHDRDGSRAARIPAARLSSAAFEWALICDLVPVEATSITLRREAALAVGGFCERLRLSEDREFLIRLAPHGAALLVEDPLWEKYWGDDNLSNAWERAGPGLLAYVRERSEYLTRYRKLASYLATKVLVADLRLGLWGALWRDLRDFRAAGLIDANILRLIRDHREVRRYRRAMSGAAGLAQITAPPPAWC